jgi:drug/metabolite transporter (DMT)-like permease
MIEGVSLALIAAVVYGFLGIVFEIAGKRKYKVWDVILVKQVAGFLIGFLCTVVLQVPFLDLRLLKLGLIGAVAYVVTLAAYLVASREKTIAANWTIVNLSVVVPILLSVVWFGDAFTLMKALGGILTVASIVIIGGASGSGPSQKKASYHWVAHITLAFLLNGVLVILFRFVPPGEGTSFTMYFYGISALLVVPYKLLVDRTWSPPKGLVGISVAGAVTHWSGIMLTIAALGQVSKVSKETGVIVYPITNGLVIPIGVILGVILLKQHLNRRTGIGVAVGVVALICLFIT